VIFFIEYYAENDRITGSSDFLWKYEISRGNNFEICKSNIPNTGLPKNWEYILEIQV